MNVHSFLHAWMIFGYYAKLLHIDWLFNLNYCVRQWLGHIHEEAFSPTMRGKQITLIEWHGKSWKTLMAYFVTVFQNKQNIQIPQKTNEKLSLSEQRCQNSPITSHKQSHESWRLINAILYNWTLAACTWVWVHLQFTTINCLIINVDSIWMISVLFRAKH